MPVVIAKKKESGDARKIVIVHGIKIYFVTKLAHYQQTPVKENQVVAQSRLVKALLVKAIAIVLLV